MSWTGLFVITGMATAVILWIAMMRDTGAQPSPAPAPPKPAPVPAWGSPPIPARGETTSCEVLCDNILSISNLFGWIVAILGLLHLIGAIFWGALLLAVFFRHL